MFWKEFYLSFKDRFCPNLEKKFFVFTDSQNLIFKENEDVKIIYQERLGWPYDTLMRFSMFDRAKDELEKCDFIYFFNANMICEQVIKEEDILPNVEFGQNLVVVKHPGYMNKKIKYCPLERNKNSLAYIQYNKGQHYVCGGVNGGTARAYLELIEVLKKNIDIDLKKNIIALVHDESHLNRYILNRDDVRYLTPEFCNPDDLNINFEKKIRLLDKNIYLNINNIKNINKEKMLQKWIRRINKYSRGYFGNIRDCLLGK